MNKSIANVIVNANNGIIRANTFGIHFDVLLMQELKHAIVSTVKSQSSVLVSTVGEKDIVLDAAIRKKLNNLDATSHMCAALETNEIGCRLNPVDFNPILFNQELVGKPWKQVIAERNAGLHSDNWISLMIESNEK